LTGYKQFGIGVFNAHAQNFNWHSAAAYDRDKPLSWLPDTLCRLMESVSNLAARKEMVCVENGINIQILPSGLSC